MLARTTMKIERSMSATREEMPQKRRMNAAISGMKISFTAQK